MIFASSYISIQEEKVYELVCNTYVLGLVLPGEGGSVQY